MFTSLPSNKLSSVPREPKASRFARGLSPTAAGRPAQGQQHDTRKRDEHRARDEGHVRTEAVPGHARDVAGDEQRNAGDKVSIRRLTVPSAIRVDGTFRRRSVIAHITKSRRRTEGQCTPCPWPAGARGDANYRARTRAVNLPEKAIASRPFEMVKAITIHIAARSPQI